MKSNVGVWIDHNEAVVVSIDGDRTSLRRISAGIGDVPADGSERWGVHAHGAGTIVRESRQAERQRQQLHRFYQEVIEIVDHPDWIVVCGPGLARIELVKEMKLAHADMSHLLAEETAPRMPERQLVAWFRNAFNQPAPRLAHDGGSGLF